MEFFVFLMIAAGVVGILIGVAQGNARKTAQSTYQASLAALTADPSNPDKRKAALARGREYSNLTRNNKGVTVFDEVALMNDINAACAGAAKGPIEVSPINTTSIALTAAERLKNLQELKDQNLISPSEYEAKRQQLISEI